MVRPAPRYSITSSTNISPFGCCCRPNGVELRIGGGFVCKKTSFVGMITEEFHTTSDIKKGFESGTRLDELGTDDHLRSRDKVEPFCFSKASVTRRDGRKVN